MTTDFWRDQQQDFQMVLCLKIQYVIEWNGTLQLYQCGGFLKQYFLIKFTFVKLVQRITCQIPSYSREILLTIFCIVTLNDVSWSSKINGN